MSKLHFTWEYRNGTFAPVPDFVKWAADLRKLGYGQIDSIAAPYWDDRPDAAEELALWRAEEAPENSYPFVAVHSVADDEYVIGLPSYADYIQYLAMMAPILQLREMQYRTEQQCKR